jgi:hypothetical protein
MLDSMLHERSQRLGCFFGAATERRETWLELVEEFLLEGRKRRIGSRELAA